MANHAQPWHQLLAFGCLLTPQMMTNSRHIIDAYLLCSFICTIDIDCRGTTY
jgi:hypothetical protein